MRFSLRFMVNCPPFQYVIADASSDQNRCMLQQHPVLLIARPSNRRVSLLPSVSVERVEACGKTVPVVGRWTIAKFMTADPVKQQMSLHRHRDSLFQTAHAD